MCSRASRAALSKPMIDGGRVAGRAALAIGLLEGFGKPNHRARPRSVDRQAAHRFRRLPLQRAIIPRALSGIRPDPQLPVYELPGNIDLALSPHNTFAAQHLQIVEGQATAFLRQVQPHAVESGLLELGAVPAIAPVWHGGPRKLWNVELDLPAFGKADASVQLCAGKKLGRGPPFRLSLDIGVSLAGQPFWLRRSA